MITAISEDGESVELSRWSGGGRLEDRRLLTGAGRFLADDLPKGCLVAHFLRADIACAALRALALDETRSAPGVVAVFTYEDLVQAGVGPIGHEAMPRDDQGAALVRPMPLLCDGTIRHLGEPLAMIVASDLASALDAAERVGVDASEIDLPEAVAFLRRYNDLDAVSNALDGAVHRISVSLELPRMMAAPMETRGIVAVPGAEGSLLVRASTQSPFALKQGLCKHFGWPSDAVRAVAQDVGGSFGLKGSLTREDALVCWAARLLGRPLAWTATRSEAFIGDHQGRGVQGRVTLGLDAALRFLALDAAFTVDVGAYPSRRAFGMMNNIAGITGVYKIPLVSAEVKGIVSARAPLAPLRGNGRPEATYAIESAVDAAARQLGCDSVELRRRNLIAPESLPWRTPLGFSFDSGDFPAIVDAAAAGADLAGQAARRSAARARGRLFGFGFAASVESAGGPVAKPRPDYARVVVLRDGRVKIAPGVMSVGQGHETAMTRMAAAVLQIDADCIDYINGDTAAVVDGRGSGGSAGIVVAGSAMHQALSTVISEGRSKMARQAGCAEDAVSYRAGTFSVSGSNLTLTLGEAASLLPAGESWVVESRYQPAAATFPNGAHGCEIEIDPETGALEVTRYSAVLDVGRVHHAALVGGQLHGAIAMGLAPGMGERMVYDEAGQIMTGSFMDYFIPRASDLPDLSVTTLEFPTDLNPLGAKGVGEAGTVGATAAFMSAVRDALASAGVDTFDMPATPSRVWGALDAASRSGADEGNEPE